MGKLDHGLDTLRHNDIEYFIISNCVVLRSKRSYRHLLEIIILKPHNVFLILVMLWGRTQYVNIKSANSPCCVLHKWHAWCCPRRQLPLSLCRRCRKTTARCLQPGAMAQNCLLCFHPDKCVSISFGNHQNRTIPTYYMEDHELRYSPCEKDLRVKHKERIENVQRRATKLIPSLSELKKLKLPTLAYRRVRGNMIQVNKMLGDKGSFDETFQQVQ